MHPWLLLRRLITADTVQRPGGIMDRAETGNEESPQNLDEWIERFSRREMPVFAQTIREIIAISEKDVGNSTEMARVILHDPSLTSQILRVANSAYYAAGRRSFLLQDAPGNINTVTRAVLVLGFDSIRSMCQTKVVIEALLRGKQRERLVKAMADSFHAAVQARWLAALRKDKSPEEVFIATLLFHLGAMALWSFADERLVEKIEASMRKPGYTQEKAEVEVLGFRLSQLTTALSREWHLSRLLQEALEDSKPSTSRIESILLGYELAESVKKGWDHEETKKLIGRVAKSLNEPAEQVTQVVHENAREAARTAAIYGAAAASRFIPLPEEYASESPTDAEPGLPQESEETRFLPPDPLLQLKTLRELSSFLLEPSPDYNLFLSMGLEGIYRGVGMDRVLFALISKNQRNLEAKFLLGWSAPDKVQTMLIDILRGQPNLFDHVLEVKQARWVESDPGANIARLMTPDILSLMGHAPFFVMPVVVQGKAIGLIYADRSPSGRPLDPDSFASFQHFAQQINMGLSFISQRKT
jgi:HD-like signal output (HDOD) protein